MKRPTLQDYARLPFSLPEFTRITWVSEKARTVWEPRMQSIVAAWAEIEWLSVLNGVRKCAVIPVVPDYLPKLSWVCLKANLFVLPIELVNVSKDGYSNRKGRLYTPSNYIHRVVIGSRSDVESFWNAFEANDNVVAGHLLGFPECCIKFFEVAWDMEGLSDTTWPMSLNTLQTDQATYHENTIEISPARESNILLRSYGIRMVPHFPCHFVCEGTIELGRRLTHVGCTNGYAREMEWLAEMLSWSAEWSCLHGISEVKTPVFKISCQTVATSKKYTVRLVGGSFPDERADGLAFPFAVPNAPKHTSSSAYRRGAKTLLNVLP